MAGNAFNNYYGNQNQYGNQNPYGEEDGNSPMGNMFTGANIGALLSSLFGGKTDYMKAANPYFQQMPDYLNKGYDQYINQGNDAGNYLQQQYQDLMKDPSQMMNKIGQGYQQSPGYQFNVDQATQGANNAASAGGMVGTPAEQAELAKHISGLASQDYGSYMNNALGLYNTGTGSAQQMNNQGFNASNTKTQSLMDMLKSQAQLAYANSANRGQRASGIGSLLGAGAGLALGGPMGAGLGKKISSWF